MQFSYPKNRAAKKEDIIYWVIRKHECYNHVQRQLINKLKALADFILGKSYGFIKQP